MQVATKSLDEIGMGHHRTDATVIFVEYSCSDNNGMFHIINRMKDARYPCNEVFVWLGGKRSGVYGIEACPAELEAFESEFEAKKPVMWLAQRTGSYCEAVRILCGESQMGEDAAREFRSLFPWKKIRNEK